MAITKEFVQNVRLRLNSEPHISTARLAADLETSEINIITALPVKMRRKARPQDFAAIWAELGTLSALPEASPAEHQLGHIWFVNSPAEAEHKCSVRFFGKKGEPLLSVDLKGEIANEAYNVLCQRFGVIPKPKTHCKGCGRCTCGKNGIKHHADAGMEHHCGHAPVAQNMHGHSANSSHNHDTREHRHSH